MVATDEALLLELRKQTEWLRLLGIQQLRPLLLDTLSSDAHRMVYELSDGTRSVREIASAAGVSAASVSRFWSRWASLGLVVESEQYPGRSKHLMSLTALGLPSPEVTEGKSSSRERVDGSI
jgi:hypothetical protein